VADVLVSLEGFGVLAYLGLYNLFNCVNALWYFSFKTDHSAQTTMFYVYQGFFWQSFFTIGLGFWLLLKGKEYPQS